MSELVRAIRTIAGVNLKDNLHLADAEVISVDVSNRTAQVQLIHGDSNQIITARLMSSVADGCLYIPKTDGNTVVIAYSDYVEPYIALHGDIDSIVWLGGEYEGVPIVTHPSNPNKGLLKRLNEIENKIEDLQTVLSSWVVASGDGGLALKTASTSWYSTPITLTSQTDIEHPNITH